MQMFKLVYKSDGVIVALEAYTEISQSHQSLPRIQALLAIMVVKSEYSTSVLTSSSRHLPPLLAIVCTSPTMKDWVYTFYYEEGRNLV